jgi:hypothetical protein
VEGEGRHDWVGRIEQSRVVHRIARKGSEERCLIKWCSMLHIYGEKRGHDRTRQDRTVQCTAVLSHLYLTTRPGSVKVISLHRL